MQVAMTDVIKALPSRPLHARPPRRIMGHAWAVLGLLLFAGGLVALLIWVAPVLVTDYQVRGAAVPIRGGHLTDGTCHSRLFIHDCDVTLTAPVGAGTVTRDVHYLFASFSMGDFTARVVADPRQPQWLTTDLGLDRFWDRVVSLLVAIALLLALIAGGFLQFFRSRRNRIAWRAAPLVPVPLQLLKVQKTRDGAMWTVRADSGRTAQWSFPWWSKPFVLGPADRVLGLATQNGGALMPLDAKLRWVDLTAQERAAVLAVPRG